MKKYVMDALIQTAKELGSVNRHRTDLASEAERLRKEVAKLNDLVARLGSELDVAEDMLVRMEEERDDLAFRLEESNGE